MKTIPELSKKTVAGAVRVFGAIGDRARQVLARWKRRQHERATYLSLLALDPRTLRDLGLHRCELSSVAAEASRSAYLTRVRFVPIRPVSSLHHF